MAITYERILKANIGRECKDFLNDLLERKSNLKFDFLEVMEVELGPLFMDRIYPFKCIIGILDEEYKNPTSVMIKGTIGLWGTSIGMIMNEDEMPIWYVDESLNICNGITTLDI